jgi:hypothetical protein
MSNFTVGQKVRAVASIYEPADDFAPGGYLCHKGETLVVRRVDATGFHPVKVSHENVTDRSFGVQGDEIEPLPAGVGVPDGEVKPPAGGRG